MQKIIKLSLYVFAAIGAVVIAAAVVRGVSIGSVMGEIKSIFSFSAEA